MTRNGTRGKIKNKDGRERDEGGKEAKVGHEARQRDKDWCCQLPYDKRRRYEDGRAAETERLTFPEMPHVSALLCHSPQNNMSGA